MAKRSIEDTINEDSNSEFKYDDSENQLRKKIKIESQKILDKIKEIQEDINISEHEAHKFLLIFHTLIETINSEQPQEETDRFVTDAVLQIVNTIAGLLRNNIDNSEEGKTGEVEPENAEHINETQKASNNNDRVRIRNRGYEIKRFLAQPRNVDVKHNGRVVRRMVLRRKTIYPSARRRREY